MPTATPTPPAKKAPARRAPSKATSTKKARRGTGDALPAWADDAGAVWFAGDPYGLL